MTEIRSACAWVWVCAVASGEVIDQGIWLAPDLIRRLTAISVRAVS